MQICKKINTKKEVGRLAEKEREEPIAECRIIQTEDGFLIEAKGEWAVKLREALVKGELAVCCGPGMAGKGVACC